MKMGKESLFWLIDPGLSCYSVAQTLPLSLCPFNTKDFRCVSWLSTQLTFKKCSILMLSFSLSLSPSLFFLFSFIFFSSVVLKAWDGRLGMRLYMGILCSLWWMANKDKGQNENRPKSLMQILAMRQGELRGLKVESLDKNTKICGLCVQMCGLCVQFPASLRILTQDLSKWSYHHFHFLTQNKDTAAISTSSLSFYNTKILPVIFILMLQWTVAFPLIIWYVIS